MRHVRMIAVAALALAAPSLANAQVAESTLRGVAAAELREIATGWSAKRKVLGQPVFNDKGEKIGKVDDIIVSPTKSVSYAIIGVGGFLGVDKHEPQGGSRGDVSSGDGPETGDNRISLAQRRLVLVGGFDDGELGGRVEEAGKRRGYDTSAALRRNERENVLDRN